MSAKEVKSATEAQQTDKVMTKYDLKMQKRKDKKKKDERSLMIWKIVGVLLLACLIGFVLSFPVRNIVARTKTVVTIGDKKISRVEFDYMYNTVKTNYIQNYGSYLSYYGLTETSDPSTIMYSDKLSFKDYFEELTVEQLKQNIALDREAKNAGFTCDTADEWKLFLDTIKSSAKENKMSNSEFIRFKFGEYATKANIKPIFENTIITSEYYQSIYDSKLPTDSEIDTYYAENKDNYDSVDYYMTVVNAEMPTEPTDLADEGAEVGEDGSYTPSDAEVTAAMEDAKAEADKLEKTIMTEGEEHIGELRSATNYYIRDWLFAEERKEGETAVITNTASNLYYVVGFSSRYRAEEPTVDIRAIVAKAGDVTGIMSEWNSGDQSEDAFIKLVETYSEDKGTEGGLYENQSEDTYEGDIKDWIFSSDRKAGDVSSFVITDDYTYVIYYKGPADPVWKVSVTDAIMTDRMNEYSDSIVEGMEAAGDLYYLQVKAEEEAEAEAEAQAQETQDTVSEE